MVGCTPTLMFGNDVLAKAPRPVSESCCSLAGEWQSAKSSKGLTGVVVSMSRNKAGRKQLRSQVRRLWLCHRRWTLTGTFFSSDDGRDSLPGYNLDLAQVCRPGSRYEANLVLPLDRETDGAKLQ
eukprot:scaffold326409_cov37-Prasinocladus_malaysianus.AAC.1